MQATLLAKDGRLSEAIAAYQEAASLDPLCPDIPVYLSVVYLGTGQIELAEAAANRALGIAPNHGRGAPKPRLRPPSPGQASGGPRRISPVEQRVLPHRR